MIFQINHINFILFAVFSLKPIHNCLKIKSAPRRSSTVVYYKGDFYITDHEYTVYTVELTNLTVIKIRNCPEEWPTAISVGFERDEMLMCGQHYCRYMHSEGCHNSIARYWSTRNMEMLTGKKFLLLIDSTTKYVRYFIQLFHPRTWLSIQKGNFYFKEFTTSKQHVFISGTLNEENEVDRHILFKLTALESENILHTFDQRFLNGSDECGIIEHLMRGEILLSKKDQYIIIFIDDRQNECLLYWSEESASCSFTKFKERYSLSSNIHKSLGKCHPSVDERGSLETFKLRKSKKSKVIRSKLKITNGLYACIKINSKKICMLFYGCAGGELGKVYIDMESLVIKHFYTIHKFHRDSRVIYSDDEFIYGLASGPGPDQREMFKAEFFYCHRHSSSCSECLNGDPNCMWCPFDLKCVTFTNECMAAIPAREITKCPAIQTQNPDSIIAGPSNKMEVTLHHLPIYPSFGYTKCKWFNESGFLITSDATVKGLTLTCNIPNQTPSKEKEKWTIRYEILYQRNKTDKLVKFLSDNGTVNVYSCIYYKSCNTCQDTHRTTGYPYSCYWDINDAICDTSLKVKQSSKCPFIVSTDGYRIPKTFVVDIPLIAENLPNPIIDGFKCKVGEKWFEFETTSPTQGKCKAVNPSFASISKFKTTIEMSVTNGEKYIDVKGGNKLELVVYDCTRLTLCYDGCLEYQRQDYYCQWSNKSCINEIGSSQHITACYPPNVTHIHPVDGPLKGGTLVSIYGNYLDYPREELKDNLLLAGVACNVKDISRHLLRCYTGETAKEKTGTLKITKHTLNSIQFTYKKVTFISVLPDHCFTDLTSKVVFHVKNFEVGLKQNFTYTPLLECDSGDNGYFMEEFKKLNGSQFEVKCPDCSKHKNASTHTVKAKVDGYSSSFKPFYMTPLPKIVRLIDEDSIESGGIRIRLQSDNPARFYRKLEMRVFYDSAIVQTIDCKFSGELSYCETPPLDDLPNTTFDRYRIDFRAEPIERQFYTFNQSFELTYVSDPVFKNLTESGRTGNPDVFIIKAEKGTTLLKGAREFDYELYIGDYRFTDPTITKSGAAFDISALPDKYMEQLMPVKIKIGKFFEQYLGFQTMRKSNPLVVFFPILLFVLLCILITVISLFFAKRARESEEEEEEEKKLLFDTGTDKALLPHLTETGGLCYMKQFLKTAWKPDKDETSDDGTISLYKE